MGRAWARTRVAGWTDRTKKRRRRRFRRGRLVLELVERGEGEARWLGDAEDDAEFWKDDVLI
jgi:hypothetical protein